MRIREFRHVDELNRLPRDYVEIHKHENDHPEPFKKRLVAFIVGITAAILMLIYFGRAVLSLFC